ncbi:hypothetical protein O181_122404 [Austropuccinia psidii MF-1]|uniref:Uncharacterized protein n=1 Tax=Austropuccinia psidii MF-1 TaxID=1389203 RepID=A0A9Q3KKH1_9BASI|nr:hypothetical protein [Austropuccinia psidii MF-1]
MRWTPLTTLTLALPSRHAFDATYNPYAHHPQDETMMPPPISTLTTPYASAPRLIFSASYNSYAPAAPSRYVSDATLNPPYA